MNKEQLIQLAFEVAGPNKWWEDDDDLVAFAERVAALERAACRDIAALMSKSAWGKHDAMAQVIVNEINRRSNH